MIAPTQNKPLVVSPNYKFLIKTKNDPSLENKNPLETKPKSRKLRILNEFKKKEENWNARFVNSIIPDYNCFRDKYCDGYSQYLMKNQKKFKIEFAPGKIRKKPSELNNDSNVLQQNRKYRPDSVDNRSNRPPTGENPFILKVNKQVQVKRKMNLELQGESLRNMRDELIKIWDKNIIPDHHREIFDICCKEASVQRLHEIFFKEMEELQNKKSPILAAVKAIKAREGCLTQLKQIEKMFKGDQENYSNEKLEEMINKSSELLTHLRILSLNVVECVSKWKENFSYLFLLANSVYFKQGALVLPYLFNNENYLLKMIKDLEFLHYSHLGNFFNFSTKNDPFLTNLTHEDLQPISPERIIQYISKTLMNRIKICEGILLEEVMNEKINKGKFLPGQLLDMKFPNSEENEMSQLQFKGNAGNIYLSKPPISNKAAIQRDFFNNNNRNNGNLANLEVSDKKNSSFTKDSPNKIPTPSYRAKLEKKINSPLSLDSYSKTPIKQTPEKYEDDEKSETKTQQKYEEDKTEEKKSDKIEKTIDKIEKKQKDSPPLKQIIIEEPIKKVIPPQVKEKETLSTIQQEKTLQNLGTTIKISEIPELYEDDLEDFLNNYLNSINEKFRNTFFSSISEIMHKSTQEDLNFLQFLDINNQRIGLAILHIDKNFLLFKRMSILHFSLIQDYPELLNLAVKELLSMIWTKDNCEEIRINLYHSTNYETNELELEKPMQEIFLSKGFRWKLLTNDKTSGTRFTTFGLRRKPEEFKAPQMQSEPIIFKSCTILSEALLNKEFIQESKSIYDNVNCQMNALKEYNSKEENGISENMNEQLKCFKNLNNFVMPGMKCKDFVSNQDIKKFMMDNEFNEVNEKLESEELEGRTICSLLKTCYRWEYFRTLDLKQGKTVQKFLRIIPDISSQDLYYVGIIAGTNNPMFIIPTDDDKVKAFIYSADEDTLRNSTNNESFSLYVRNIVKNIEETQNLSKELWIPCFKMNIPLRTIPEISCAKTSLENFEFSINYENRLGGLLKTKKNAEEFHLIKPPFVFGLLHTDLEEKMEIQYSAVMVSEEDCIKIK